MSQTWPHEIARAELESLIRFAGDVVQVSPDLRPRVLEAARAEHRCQLRRRWAVCAVAAVLLLAALSPRSMTTQTAVEVAAGQPAEQHATAAPESVQRLASSPSSWIAVSGGNDWEMVENFCRLRQHHLQVLQRAF